MKKIAILLSLLFVGYQVQAQQIHQLTQYMSNNYAYNPAVAGSSDMFVSKMQFRKQWAGLEGSPTTFLVSLHGSILPDSKSVGLGAILYSDVTGPTARSGMQLSYAYQLPLDNLGETHLGLGIAGNFMQYRIKFDELVLRDDNDPQIGTGKQSKIGADAHLGAYLSNKNYWAGISVNQLFASKFSFVADGESVQNNQHIYLTGGYKYDFSQEFALEPGLLLKMAKGASPQAEIFARGIYTMDDNQYWLGASLRTADAVNIMVGVNLDNGFNFGYSYDITTSGLNKVSNGSHELSLGFNFSIFQ